MAEKSLPVVFGNKSPEIIRDIEKAFPGTGDAIAAGLCPCCKGPATEFRDALSRKEFGTSGLCQKCQDEVFGDEH